MIPRKLSYWTSRALILLPYARDGGIIHLIAHYCRCTAKFLDTFIISSSPIFFNTLPSIIAGSPTVT